MEGAKTHHRAIDDLQDFNAQVLQLQDEAYTLACYLLHDERQASEVVQSAFLGIYRQGQGYGRGGELGKEGQWDRENIRLAVLKWVVRAWQSARHRRTAGQNKFNQDMMTSRLGELPDDEQICLILVDMLGLDYRQASEICRKPVRSVGQQLAIARQKLTHAHGLPQVE